MKALAVIGTRPEAIKLAPVVRALGARVLLTGQHPSEMVFPILKFFNVHVDHEIESQPGRDLNELLSDLITDIDFFLDGRKSLALEPPDCVIVQGDTTSALAGALAAFNRQIPVAHVEAGLRTYDLSSPFPEEANRQLIGRLAYWHFCPTDKAKSNLLHEGPCPDVHVVGNTSIDSVMWARDKIGPCFPGNDIICTVHRRENIAKIPQICDALNALGLEFSTVATIHPNPEVTRAFNANLSNMVGTRVAPAYPDFLALMAGARIVLTDSGGVTEEAPCFNKPVLILRENTERNELVEAGGARIVGTDPDEIVSNALELLTDKDVYERMASTVNPFGDGHAAERIAEVLLEVLNG